MNKKLSCHCGGVEAQVKVPESGFKKVMRCNCTLCKRKGYIIGVIGPDDFLSMEEVVYRRYKRMIENGEPLPQLIIIDGGKGQLNSSLSALQRLNIDERRM